MKYKLIYINSNSYGDIYDQYSESNTFIASGLEWKEISDDEFNKLNNAIAYYNNKSHIGKIVVVTEFGTDRDLETILGDYDKFIAKIEKERKEAIEKAAKIKADRETKSLDRKKKQLAKLKSELGEA